MPEEFENVEPDKYAPFMAGAWIEVTTADLAVTMPEDAEWARVNKVFGNGDGLISYDILPFGEFTISKVEAVQGNVWLVKLSAHRGDGNRQHRMSREDYVQWDTFLQSIGYTLETWLTKAEATDLRSSDKYTTQGEV